MQQAFQTISFLPSMITKWSYVTKFTLQIQDNYKPHGSYIID